MADHQAEPENGSDGDGGRALELEAETAPHGGVKLQREHGRALEATPAHERSEIVALALERAGLDHHDLGAPGSARNTAPASGPPLVRPAPSARSPPTRAQWRQFEAWAGTHTLEPLPAHSATVAAYLADRAEFGASVSTLRVASAAISAAHRDRGHADPTGATLPELMQAGRWASPEMPAHYARSELAAQGAVARYHSRNKFPRGALVRSREHSAAARPAGERLPG